MTLRTTRALVTAALLAVAWLCGPAARGIACFGLLDRGVSVRRAPDSSACAHVDVPSAPSPPTQTQLGVSHRSAADAREAPRSAAGRVR
jgi:hypothetical protein